MMKNHFAGYLRDGGVILYNATTMKMIEEDQFTDFTMRFMGWYIGFKTINDIRAIAIHSKKFEIISDFLTRTTLMKRWGSTIWSLLKKFDAQM